MRCLEPDYLKDFICDGKRCGAQCCRLWTVFVDAAAFERLSDLPQERQKEITGHLVPGEGSNAPWAWDFGEEKVCHFLREDFLCDIQKAHGEAYLGNTCAIYPRKPVNIGGNFQMSLSLSCPLAAELAVFRDTPVEFVWREEGAVRPSGWQEIACRQGEEGVAVSCLLLQDTGLAILQQQGALLKKLSTLLAYLTETDQAVDAGDFDKMLALADAYSHGRGKAEKDFSWNLEEHFPGLRESLAQVEGKNQHLLGLHKVTTEQKPPPLELLLENILVSEYFLEIFPCTLGGTLQHNGLAFLALAMLYHERILPFYEQGDSAGLLLAVNKVSTLMGHDRQWQETLSQNILNGLI